MFEAAELGQKVSKEEFGKAVLDLRTGLLKAQFALRDAKFPVIIVIAGVDGAGKGDTVNRLHEWLDPRGLETNVFGTLTDEEKTRPPYWRFWRTLPPKGRIGIFFGSWYTDPIVRRAYGAIGGARLDQEMHRVARFEQMLAEDGALILKFWFHLSKKAQRKRLEKFEASKKTAWKVSPNDWKHHKLYDKFVKICERSLRHTDTAYAPWMLVEAEDDNFRDLTVGRKILEALEQRLSNKGPAIAAHAVSAAHDTSNLTILDKVDLATKVDAKDYEKQLLRLQGRLNRLTREAWEKGVSSVILYEGWDAAGKGGNIRRLTGAMDARSYRVISIAAPTDEERAQHYLWRFWRHIPRAGQVTVFDRTWYGRVLVERVEKFAKEAEWSRAYGEINDFEEQLVEHGVAVSKLWIHISAEEQLRRFQERQQVEFKQHKITEEDWRNREKWDAYEIAINEMIARTSTSLAPWSIIPGNDKRLARLRSIETVCDCLEARLRG
jgi:polyphosphate:AMP phosphotransferase